MVLCSGFYQHKMCVKLKKKLYLYLSFCIYFFSTGCSQIDFTRKVGRVPPFFILLMGRAWYKQETGTLLESLSIQFRSYDFFSFSSLKISIHSHYKLMTDPHYSKYFFVRKVGRLHAIFFPFYCPQYTRASPQKKQGGLSTDFSVQDSTLRHM